jgi:selenocysteine lyase/cysteine desulfurase
VAYLNCAYMSPLAGEVLDAVQSGAQRKAAPWTYRAQDFFDIPEAARRVYGQVFGVDVESIALVPSASYGLAVASANLPLASGQDIVLLGEQFPANVYIWREKARAAGARLIHTQRGAGQAWTAGVLDAIGPQTAIVAVPHCHWADGGLVDLAAVGKACRAVGAALVLDLTQSLGALPINFAEVDPDFAVAAGYKWLMSPYGTGALYVAPRYHSGTSIEQPWMGRQGAEDFSRLVNYCDAYAAGARRFDMGEKSNPALLEGVIAALGMILEWSVTGIHETLSERNAALAQRVEPLGYLALPPKARAGHFLGLSLPDHVDAAALLAQLSGANVFVSARGRSLRVTQHLYNDAEDSERFIEALSKFA